MKSQVNNLWNGMVLSIRENLMKMACFSLQIKNHKYTENNKKKTKKDADKDTPIRYCKYKTKRKKRSIPNSINNPAFIHDYL